MTVAETCRLKIKHNKTMFGLKIAVSDGGKIPNFLSHNCDTSQNISFTFEVCCSVSTLLSTVLMNAAHLVKPTGIHLLRQTKEHQLLATGNLIRPVQKIMAECVKNNEQLAAAHWNNLFPGRGTTCAAKKHR
jgi:hypothetical protein